jgi:hypothetical protein
MIEVYIEKTSKQIFEVEQIQLGTIILINVKIYVVILFIHFT